MGKRFKKHSKNNRGERKDKPREILTNGESVAVNSAVKPITSPQKRIAVLSHSSPMRFNRAFFQMAADQMREQSYGYYLVTKILQPVRRIQDSPNYSELYKKMLIGDFKDPKKEVVPVMVSDLSPFICLTANGKFDTADEAKFKPAVATEFPYDLLVKDMKYKICDNFKDISGDWQVLYYLYRVYELHGFGDLAIDGQPYRIRFHPNSAWKEDLVLAKQNDRLILGRMKT